MDDACLVRRRQRRSHLNGDVERFAQIRLPRRYQLAQGFAFDQFGGNKMRAVEFSDFVNRDDIRVIQR